MIAALSGFILVFAMNVFGPRHKLQSPLDDQDDDDVGPVTTVPATLYEGGETTRSTKERTPQRSVSIQRPVSLDPGSPMTPRLTTKERMRANTSK